MRRKRIALATLLALLLSLLLYVPMSLVGPTPAHAATDWFAGNGNYGYNGTDIPAKNASLAYPQDLATDLDGNVFFADNANHIIRKVDTGGVIRAVYGTPQTVKNVANGGLNYPIGVAVRPDGGVYIADATNNVVWLKTPGGSTNLFAGNPQGIGGPTQQGDGLPATHTDVRLSGPQYVAYDQATGDVYISVGGRIRKVSGTIPTITTVAGTGTCGYSSSEDGGQATSAKICATDLTVANGKLYFADGNRVRVVDLASGVINTVGGNGSYNDTGDGGQAINAAIKGPKGIAVDPVGNIYVGTAGGYIRRISPAGVISSPGAIAGSINGMGRDRFGNVYVSTSWYSKIYKMTNHTGVTVGTPSATVTPTTPLYNMKVTVSLSGVSCPAAASVWVPSTAAYATKSLCGLGGTAPSSASVDLPVTSLNPETSYELKALIDDGNGTSQTSIGSLTTPKAPLIVALGDSITSGHHRETPEATMTCDDANYGYPRYFKDAVAAYLPSQWAPQYVNLAHSGFSTDQVINNGANACGVTPLDVPLNKAAALLSQNVGSWNRVLATAGINDTDWGDRLSAIGSNAATQITYTEEDCTNDLSTWSGWQEVTVGQQMSTNISTIVDDLRTADPAVKIDWLGYYNVAGSGSPVPASCEEPFDEALDQLGSYVATGIAGRDVTFVQVDTVMHMQTSKLQAYSLPWDMDQGWPHPNSSGASTIAGLLQP